jgi:hypothetical protein
MTKLKFLPKPDIIYIFRRGKPLLIYAACFALSLVKLCCISYERFVMLLKSRSRTHHPYIHNSYTGNRNNHSSFSTQIHLKMFSPTMERTPKNLTYRTTLNKCSNFLLQSLSIYFICRKKRHVAIKKEKKKWTSVLQLFSNPNERNVFKRAKVELELDTLYTPIQHISYTYTS